MIEVADIASIAEEKLPVFLSELEHLVNIDSGTFDKAGVDAVVAVLRNRYQQLGGTVETLHEPVQGDHLRVTFTGNGTGRILLLGHTDTVFPAGTAAERPFRADRDRAYGPGVADMKGGDLLIVYALEALFARGWDAFHTVTVVHNSDEEIGSPTSRELVRSEAEHHDAVLVMEPGRENGNIVSARKGIADCRLEVRGVASHAGVSHDRGRSAVLELAHLITGLEGLNRQVPGATLNIGRIGAGERINIVPDYAFAHFEIRAFEADSLRAMIERAQEIVARRTVADTTATLRADIQHFPMDKSEESSQLVKQAQELAAQLGFAIHDVATGGASDGNTAAQTGRPVLDGLGPVGGAAHSAGEYIELASVVPRCALLAGLLVSLGI